MLLAPRSVLVVECAEGVPLESAPCAQIRGTLELRENSVSWLSPVERSRLNSQIISAPFSEHVVSCKLLVVSVVGVDESECPCMSTIV